MPGFLSSPISPSSPIGPIKASKAIGLRIALTALCGILSAVAALTFVWATKEIVDVATHRPDESFALGTTILILSLAAQMLLGIASRRLSASSTVRFSNTMRTQLFDRLMRARWTGRDRFHSGESVNRLTTDVGTVSSFYASTVPGCVTAAVQLTIAFIYLALLSGKMAIAVAAIMPLALLLSKTFLRTSRRLTREIRERESTMYSALQENLQHRLLISTLRYTAGSVNAFAAMQRRFYAATMRRNDITLFAGGMVTFGFMAGYAVAFLWCANGLRTGAVTFGVMTAFMQLVAQVQRPVVDLARKIPLFIQAKVSMERLQEVMQLPVESGEDLPPLKGGVGVRFRNVTFRYPDSDKYILKNFSHDFTPSSMTAVAGETGAGKTTLILLMMGVLTPQEGSVEIYSEDGECVESTELTRSNFVYVPQGNTLQSGTVRGNLRIANPEATDAEIFAALHAAAADFVKELPLQLDTPCGERGAGFSEGQAQRIAIARGLLRKGGMIVLDEPTSALDAATEKTLMGRLREKAGDRTIIIVTHHDTIITGSESITLSPTPAQVPPEAAEP